MNPEQIVDCLLETDPDEFDPKQYALGSAYGKPKSITVIGRRWFRRGYGGTYHTATIKLDDKEVHTTPIAYGYDQQYLDTAAQWLESQGILRRKRSANGGSEAIWRVAKAEGIDFQYWATDVRRQKDL